MVLKTNYYLDLENKDRKEIDKNINKMQEHEESLVEFSFLISLKSASHVKVPSWRITMASSGSSWTSP